TPRDCRTTTHSTWVEQAQARSHRARSASGARSSLPKRRARRRRSARWCAVPRRGGDPHEPALDHVGVLLRVLGTVEGLHPLVLGESQRIVLAFDTAGGGGLDRKGVV